MGESPRRKRARLKAWVYLAVFGGGGDAGEGADGPTPDPQRDDERGGP